MLGINVHSLFLFFSLIDHHLFFSVNFGWDELAQQQWSFYATRHYVVACDSSSQLFLEKHPLSIINTFQTITKQIVPIILQPLSYSSSLTSEFMDFRIAMLPSIYQFCTPVVILVDCKFVIETKK